MCNKSATFVCYISECSFCSKECEDKFWEEYEKKFQKYLEGLKEGKYEC